jgi:hypothetical protein
MLNQSQLHPSLAQNCTMLPIHSGVKHVVIVFFSSLCRFRVICSMSIAELIAATLMDPRSILKCLLSSST